MSNLIEHLSKEHREVLIDLDRLEDLLTRIALGASLESEQSGIRLFLGIIDKGVKHHFDEEEEILFPVMIKSRYVDKEHIAEILVEHVYLYNYFNEFKKAYSTGNTQDLIKSGKKILEFLRLHIDKEERVTLQMAKSILGSEEIEELDQLKKLTKELKNLAQ